MKEGMKMGRNYEKEAKWKKEKYCRILADIEKEKGEKFKEKLRKENRSVSDFINEKIDEYLKK